MRCGALWLWVCLAARAWPQQPSEIDRAIDEFKVQTANLGLRADSPAQSVKPQSSLREWHGRLYENFRNDFLDAVPHEIT
jgi:hypothetical protein